MRLTYTGIQTSSRNMSDMLRLMKKKLVNLLVPLSIAYTYITIKLVGMPITKITPYIMENILDMKSNGGLVEF